MGRYYSGDINGKFWFSVQESNDASFFGGEEVEPNYINYYFGKEDLPKVKAGLRECQEALGPYREKLDKYFKEHDGYNDNELANQLGVERAQLLSLLEWYARLQLGTKIEKCLVEHGECTFEAEL